MATYFTTTTVSAVDIVPAFPGTSYAALVNSLGTTKYEVVGISLQCSDIIQLQQPISFQYVNPNGEVKVVPFVPVKNMFTNENVPVLDLDLTGMDIIFDSNLYMAFNLLPYTDLQIIFDVKKSSFAQDMRSQLKFMCAKKYDLFEQNDIIPSAPPISVAPPSLVIPSVPEPPTDVTIPQEPILDEPQQPSIPYLPPQLVPPPYSVPQNPPAVDNGHSGTMPNKDYQPPELIDYTQTLNGG